MKTELVEQPDDRLYHAFLLRLWRENEKEGWRVMLENVQSGEKQGFAGISSLIQFIYQQTNTEQLD